MSFLLLWPREIKWQQQQQVRKENTAGAHLSAAPERPAAHLISHLAATSFPLQLMTSGVYKETTGEGVVFRNAKCVTGSCCCARPNARVQLLMRDVQRPQ